MPSMILFFKPNKTTMATVVKNITEPTPAWVGAVVAASTILLQGLPMVMAKYSFVTPHALEITSFGCDMGNMAIAAFAIFFRYQKTE